MQPLISVIIPTYNRKDFLLEAIHSVCAQTYKHIEIIVVDDGSTDDTRNAISTLTDIRIKYFYQSNSGLPAVARNHGLRKATGEYIAFLDSDDLWFIQKLEVQLGIIHNNPALTLVATNGVYFPKGMVFSVNPSNRRIDLKSLLLQNEIVNSSVLFRRSVIDKIGFLDEDSRLRAVEDYDYWLRILQFQDNSVIILSKKLVKYRVHQDNISKEAVKERLVEQYKKEKIIYEKYASWSPEYLKRISLNKIYTLKKTTVSIDFSTKKISLFQFINEQNISIFDKIKILIRSLINSVICLNFSIFKNKV